MDKPIDQSKTGPCYYNKYYDGKITQTEGKLPHISAPHVLQFVTFHLADSLPAKVRKDLMEERETWLKNHSEPYAAEEIREYKRLFNDRVETWLNNGYGSCILDNPEIETIVDSEILSHNHVSYELYSYVIMPNHVHMLVETYEEGPTLQEILDVIKSRTAHLINGILGREGIVWHTESFDTMIRSELHHKTVVGYIEKNRNLKWRLQKQKRQRQED